MLMKKRQKVAIFDRDGTIFRSSLLIELMDALISKGVFPPGTSKKYLRAYKAWYERICSYEDYVRKVVAVYEKSIKNTKYSDFMSAVKIITAFHQNEVYKFTRELVKELKKKKYYLLAISHSPREIVESFAMRLGFNKVYGRIYETKKGRFTGKILYTDLIDDKSKILKRAVEKENLSLKGSIGVGDTEGDISFLKIVSRPVCFNPNQHLYKYAKRAGWEVVVERKDVVYKL